MKTKQISIALSTRNSTNNRMILRLLREYHPLGTNGRFFFQKQLLCNSIELPWRDNRRNISCIPEGKYRLYRHLFPRHGDGLGLSGVPGRNGILIHPANDALHELRGCIAPVTKTTGPGRGIHSRIALERLKDLVYPLLEAGEGVWLEVVGSGSRFSVLSRQFQSAQAYPDAPELIAHS